MKGIDVGCLTVRGFYDGGFGGYSLVWGAPRPRTLHLRISSLPFLCYIFLDVLALAFNFLSILSA